MSAKSELLERIATTHKELEESLAGLGADEMTIPGVTGEWTVKDVLSHLTFWEQNTLDYFQAKWRGEEPLTTRQPGESNRDWVDRLNEEHYQRSRIRPLDEVLAEFSGSYRQMVETLEALSEADAAPGGRVEQLFGESLDGCFAGDTYEHYEEHAGWIRQWRERQAGREA